MTALVVLWYSLYLGYFLTVIDSVNQVLPINKEERRAAPITVQCKYSPDELRLKRVKDHQMLFSAKKFMCLL